MISLIEGGHFRDKGYWYKIYMTIPEFKNHKTVNIMRSEHRSTKISLPTRFCLTRNDSYVSIVISVLGFGLGLEIQSNINRR